jgi:hypothetical protein
MALDALSIQLLAVYQDAYKTLKERLQRQELRGLSTYHTQALMADVEEIVQKLRIYNVQWINHTVPLAYQQGSDDAIEKLTEKYGMSNIDGSFGSVHQEAVKAIVTDTMTSIAAATDYMEDRLKEALRTAAKEEYQLGIITGETRRQMTKKLMGKLNQKGFTAYFDEKGRYIPLKDYTDTLLEENWVGFVDAAGRRWDLENYSEMLTRTKVTEAVSRGTENRLTSNGLDLVIITDHGAEDWCRFYANRIFSINGATPGYPLLSEAPNGGTPFHPRCKCREAPIVEKFESDEVLKYGKGLDKQYLGLNTEKGYADQAALRSIERERKTEQNRLKYGIIKSTRYPSSQLQISTIMRNELRNVKFSADVLYNSRLRCVGKTTALEKYGIVKIQKIEIGKQDKQGKAELIDTLLHEELEARIMLKAYNRNSARYKLIGKHQELTTHTYINKVIKRFFRIKGWQDGLE